MRKSSKWFLALAALVGVTLGSSTGARADFAYGYAEQTVTISISSTNLINATFSAVATNNGAAANGTGPATNGQADALVAYVGAPPIENNFTRTVGGNPPPQAHALTTRGDSLVTGAANLFTSGFTASNVAESYTNVAGTTTGAGSWTVSGSFTGTAGNNVIVSYSNYANDLYTIVSGAGNASASYKLTISIKNTVLGTTTDVSPLVLNTAFSAPPNSNETQGSGSGTASLALLGTAGTSYGYSISITGTELSSATLPVPEPTTLASAFAGLALLGLAARRSRRAA